MKSSPSPPPCETPGGSRQVSTLFIPQNRYTGCASKSGAHYQTCRLPLLHILCRKKASPPSPSRRPAPWLYFFTALFFRPVSAASKQPLLLSQQGSQHCATPSALRNLW